MLFRTKSSKIIILGLNEISINLAKRLSIKEDVVILDDRSQLEQNILDIDVMIKNIEGGLVSTLKNLQIDNANFFLSITDNDEYNLFAACLGKRLGTRQVVAMVHNFDYMDINSEIDLTFNPYQLIIDQMSTKIKDIRLLNIRNLIPGKIDISQLILKNDDAFSYLKIRNVKLNEGLIIAINRGNKTILPDPEISLLPGDNLCVIFKRGMINRFLNLFNKNKNKKGLFVLGGDRLGLTFIDCWKNFFEPIIIVEPDLERCNFLATKLENTLILHGEGTDLQLLKEEGLNESSIFLAVSRNDFYNLLTSFGAKHIGCNKIITLLSHSTYKKIGNLLNLDNVLSMPDLIADYLLDYIQIGFRLNKYILGDQIYTTQIKLEKRSPLINKNIIELNLPKGVIIGVIIRENEVIIPHGDTQLKGDDDLIIFFDKKLEFHFQHIFNTKRK